MVIPENGVKLSRHILVHCDFIRRGKNPDADMDWDE